jgi:hypothetical protein
VAKPAQRRVAAAESASVLREKLRIFRGDLTVADAAAKGGIALREAEAGLFQLSSEYGGHLKATSEGEVLFSFPEGFRKQEESLLVRGVKAVGRAIAGVGRFIIRAWVSVVLVGYALILLAVLLALAAKDEGDGAGEALAFVFRIVAEALFWTFHPFSPFVWDREPAWAKPRLRGHGKREKKVPFYEKVNRFVFGPTPVKVNEEARERLLVGEIRRLDGRVGAGDVLRLVGGTRVEAEALLCRLVVDYEGEVEVSEEGAVVYKFAALRRTAQLGDGGAVAAPPIWTEREKQPPLTGNGAGTNVFLGAVNGFNLTVGGVALANGLTVERVFQIISERAGEVAGAAEPIATGFPLFLGAIPFGFSAALFAIPAARLLTHGRKVKRVARENGRRGLLSSLVGGATPEVVEAGELRKAWLAAGGPAVGEAELTAEVRKLGGEPDVNEAGKLIYRFEDLSREARALAAERKAAPLAERSPGEVVFSSLAAPDES